MFEEMDVISSYTRENAIEDGVLIDVTETAKEAGFRFPVAVTEAVWKGYIVPSKESERFGQSVSGRLWDVLSVLFFEIRKNSDKATIQFPIRFIMKTKQKRVVWLKAICGPGDNMEPVITIMLPNED